MQNLAVNLACWLLRGNLTLTQRTKLIGHILGKLHAVPLSDVIKQDVRGLTIEGKPLDFETAVLIREGAKAMLDNPARKVVREQVAAIAGKRGIVEGDTPEKLYFYRAALWFGLTEEELYKQLASM